MNAQTTYLHHSPPPLEGTTSSRGRRAEQLQFSHKPYYRSVRTTAIERGGGERDIYHMCVGSSSKPIYIILYVRTVGYRSLVCVTRIA